ncbi:MAG: hypothetical protein KDH09_02230, partial [Chrysiogenetes bacterium]|nr:hypothetical protein [Chrysiogenetes bacterium]
MPGPDNDLSNRQLRLLWALLVGFVVFCHWDWLVLGEPIKGADISTYYTPFFEEYLRQFAKGRFPLWTNTVFSGHPIVGEGQVTLLHPLMHVLLRVCGRHAVAIWLVAHALFGALGVWYYCRALGASRFASVLAALAMALNGFFAVRVIQPNYYATLAYLPWQLLLVDKLCARKAPLYWAVPLAAVTGLQWLCGHPQIPIFSNYLLGFYTLLRLLGRVGATEETRANWIALPKVAGALMAGLALASIQLLPLVMDVVRAQSERSAGISLAFSTFGSLPPWGVLLPLLPGIYGPEGGNAEVPYWLALSGGKVASWETHIYIGAALLLLAVLALWRMRARPSTRLLGFFVLLCILFALGKFSPVFWALHYLPGLNLLRVPSRAMGPLLIFLLPLAALGLDWLAKAGEEDKRSWNKLLRGALVLCIGFWIVLGVGTRTVGPRVLEKAIEISTSVEQKKLDARGDIHPATMERRLSYATDRPTHALGQIEHATGLNPLLLSNLGFLALVGLLIGVWARASDRIRFARLSVALFVLCGAELVWFNREFGIRGSDVEVPFARPVYAEKVPEGKFFSAISPREVLGGDWNLLRHRAPALASIIWDLPTPDGRTSMQPSEYMSIILPLRG